MSSSFSSLSGALLEIVSEILDTLDDLHTAGIEFTVKRDNGRVIGLEVFIQILRAEQKQMPMTGIPKKDVKLPPMGPRSGV